MEKFCRHAGKLNLPLLPETRQFDRIISLLFDESV